MGIFVLLQLRVVESAITASKNEYQFFSALLVRAKISIKMLLSADCLFFIFVMLGSRWNQVSSSSTMPKERRAAAGDENRQTNCSRNSHDYYSSINKIIYDNSWSTPKSTLEPCSLVDLFAAVSHWGGKHNAQEEVELFEPPQFIRSFSPSLSVLVGMHIVYDYVHFPYWSFTHDLYEFLFCVLYARFIDILWTILSRVSHPLSLFDFCYFSPCIGHSHTNVTCGFLNTKILSGRAIHKESFPKHSLLYAKCAISIYRQFCVLFVGEIGNVLLDRTFEWAKNADFGKYSHRIHIWNFLAESSALKHSLNACSWIVRLPVYVNNNKNEQEPN